MTRLDSALFMLAIALSFFGALVAFDLVLALGAQPCGSAASGPNCYPWGAEGPTAGSLRYQSKAAYFMSGIVQSTLPLIATVGIVWKRRNEQPLTQLHRVLLALGLAVPLSLLLF